MDVLTEMEHKMQHGMDLRKRYLATGLNYDFATEGIAYYFDAGCDSINKLRIEHCKKVMASKGVTRVAVQMNLRGLTKTIGVYGWFPYP